MGTKLDWGTFGGSLSLFRIEQREAALRVLALYMEALPGTAFEPSYGSRAGHAVALLGDCTTQTTGQVLLQEGIGAVQALAGDIPGREEAGNCGQSHL
mgnify:CR=1 FL=1